MPGSLHPLASPAHYTGVMPFRGKPFARHKAQGMPRFPARNCDLCDSGFIAEICGAVPAKTDIDWF
jgi:hypothetical protein